MATEEKKFRSLARRLKPAVFDPKAGDGDGDRRVQDNTIHERPAPPKVAVEWTKPLFAQSIMPKPGRTDRFYWSPETKTWTKKRKKLHAAIVQHYRDQVKDLPRPENPTVYFMGGGPASLKSSALNSGKLNVPDTAFKIDTDEIKEFLPEYREWVEGGVSSAASLVQDESKYITAQVAQALLEEGVDVLYDTTGNGNYEGFKKRLEGLRSQGHRIVAHYMTNDIKLAHKLNDKRFKETGRKVPGYDLEHIHGQVSRNVPRALKDDLFDELYLYNTDDLDRGPKLILRYADGRLSVKDPAAYRDFLVKGKFAEPPVVVGVTTQAPKGPVAPSPGKPLTLGSQLTIRYMTEGGPKSGPFD